MFISGIGFISGEGIGIQALKKTQKSPAPISKTDDKIIKTYKFPRNMRRADRFSKLCMIAGNEAISDSGLSLPEISDSGIIIASALGPHETTFSFLDDLIDYSDTEVSPTKFSHSVHNAAASYTAILCGVSRLSLTIVGFDNPWVKALMAAEILIKQGQADKILLIGADEKNLLSSLLGYLDHPDIPNESIECAVGMFLTARPGNNSYCKLSVLKENNSILFTNKSGLIEKLPFAYSGNIFFGSALECATIALSQNNL